MNKGKSNIDQYSQQAIQGHIPDPKSAQQKLDMDSLQILVSEIQGSPVQLNSNVKHNKSSVNTKNEGFDYKIVLYLLGGLGVAGIGYYIYTKLGKTVIEEVDPYDVITK